MLEQYAYDICALLIFISWACGAVMIPLLFEWINSLKTRRKD